MKVGALGDIVFEVSDERIKTFTKYERSGSARLQTHNVLGQTGLVEYSGADPETVSLTFFLSRRLGVDPQFDLNRVMGYCRSGRLLYLHLGTFLIGDKWVIKSYKITGERYDRHGDLTDATVTVALTEYRRGANAI